MKIVLVHGIFNDGEVFKWLAKDLRALGHECFTPSLTPANAKHGVRDLAHKLQAYILQTIGPDEPLILVGFSMGCMISRYYLQLLQGYQRTTHFFTISGPHQGTVSAYAYWGLCLLGKKARTIYGPEVLLSKSCRRRIPA